MITNENNSHYVYIKGFNKFICNQTKNNNNRKHFYRYCLQCFSCEKVLKKHKENCLIVNGKQSVKLKSGIKSDDRNNTSYTEKYQARIPCSFAYKVVLMINLGNQLFVIREKMQLINLLK